MDELQTCAALYARGAVTQTRFWPAAAPDLECEATHFGLGHVQMLNGNHANLDLLVQELLLARTDGLAPSELAAFVDGWTSLLELLGRTDLTLPTATEEDRARIRELVQAVRSAQERILEEVDGP